VISERPKWSEEEWEGRMDLAHANALLEEWSQRRVLWLKARTIQCRNIRKEYLRRERVSANMHSDGDLNV